jgi:glycosyltransferase involved in cell wall biosynthesis
VQFVVAGRDPSPTVRALGQTDRNTIVTGTVPDLRGYLWRAAVYVCPLRIGVGIKNRLLEAMAAGCPIVSTSVGVEGMDVADGEHVLVADSPEAIASAVLRLLADRPLARRLGDAARERAVSRYSWETMAQRIEDLYTEAVEKWERPQKV